jgi:membrane-bound metal-dependent hydrolase YbcI (DUF457 family)
MFISYQGYLHGPFHTYALATLVALGLAIVYKKIKKDPSFRKILASSFIGVYSHIFLDSFLYTDIQPFYPLNINPFYMTISSSTIYNFCYISFPIALLVWKYKLSNKTSLKE